MANIKISELVVKDSPSTSATLVGVDNGETVQIPVSSLPSGGDSGGGIIDVTELPTENIDTSAIYRVDTTRVEHGALENGEWVLVQDPVFITNVVEELPETGTPVVSDDGSMFILYYQRKDGNIYWYCTEDMGAEVGKTAGWYADVEFWTFIGMPYGGKIYSKSEASTEAFSALIIAGTAKLYHYVNGAFEQLITESELNSNTSGSSSGGASIIYATEKPSTPQQAIYVITEDEVVEADVYAGGGGNMTEQYPDKYRVEIVDALPDDANVCTDTTGSFMYLYYLTTNKTVNAYVDDALATLMGASAGWYPAEVFAPAMGVSWGGIILSTEEATNIQALYVLARTQPKTRVYVPLPDGTFLELTSGIRTRFDENSGMVSITEM